MLGEEPGPGRGNGAVDRREQAAYALAAEARRQFEVAPGGGVDLHDRARHHPPRRLQMRRAALLGQTDVIDQRPGGGELGAAEIAEPVEGLDTLRLVEPASPGVALEARVG